ncbi:methylaspartate mutase [Streptomyces sp. yr375]|uniref:methylaspartate mutase n=1 Tax=Streptomyces sp. yr375 TaxID=1761906 RepID=UPI000B8176CA|nr:methylaspartate mutase [Streptomyces sp. yr375]
MSRAAVDFGRFVRTARQAGALVVQPRMGFGGPAEMRAGLTATRNAAATTAGTITLDSYTRVGDLRAVEAALRDGADLNGYPIVSHPDAVTGRVLAGLVGDDFPVQVRHGSANPVDIFRALLRVGLSATEGGPVSYCLPYGRTPLETSVRNWDRACEILCRARESGVEPHLETFGGCMLGQLCPPGLLVAISLLEALFFHRHGLRDLSVSYAQQTNAAQDQEAVLALRRLCAEFLPDTRWHVVIYTYMGMYPASREGAYQLLGQAAELAVATGSERLIVKTEAEASRIPTIAENVAALEYAAGAARRARPILISGDFAEDSQVYAEARTLVEAVLNLHDDMGKALLIAFRRGFLDIPYCVHPDNMGRTRSYIDQRGRLRWGNIGLLPLRDVVDTSYAHALSSAELLRSLSYVRRKFDEGGSADPISAQGVHR